MHSDRIQLVWDSGCAGTAQTGSGTCLMVGTGGKWTPEQLLLIAAESSIMAEFMRLASRDGLDVLGYVSSAGTVEEKGAGRIRVMVRPCVVVARQEELPRAKELLTSAVRQSRVALALSAALCVKSEVVLVSPSVVGFSRG